MIEATIYMYANWSLDLKIDNNIFLYNKMSLRIFLLSSVCVSILLALHSTQIRNEKKQKKKKN